MKRITSLIVCFMLFGFFAVHAQDIQIKGTVTSQDDGDPLPGVSVVVKGTNIGIATDVNGEYSLPVPSDATLVFSAVGMKTQEVAVAGQSVVNLALESELVVMDEVVVTALGISREKKSLGYAVQDVNAEELNSTIQQSTLGALSGKVAGLDVMSSSKIGGSQRILIRGATSITGENQPLIVVDGIPLDNCGYNTNTANGYGGDDDGFGGYDLGNMLNDLSPENIESVSVLKGPAAAIYGSRAANGVVVITTKKAKSTQKGYSVELSSTLGFEQTYLMPALQNKYGGGAIINDADGGVNGFEQVNINGTDYNILQYQVDESWGPRYDPNISVLHWDAFDQESYPNDYLVPRPWVASANDVETFYDLGVNFTNNIAVTNAGEKHAIRFSYTNTNIKGTMPGSEQHKHNFGLNGSAKIGKKIGVNAALNYVDVYTKGRPQVGYGDNSTGQKFFQWSHRQLDFERMQEYTNNDGTMRTWNRVAWDDPTPRFSDNPYWTSYVNYPDDSRKRYYGNLSISYEIMEGLTAKGSIYGDGYAMYNRERTAVGSQATSKYYEGVRSWIEMNYEGILTYTKQLGGINLTVFGGGNTRKYQYDFNRGLTSGGLVVPEVYNLKNSVDLALTNDETDKKHVNSLFGSASIDINGLLFLEGTVRNDWSSALPDDNNSYFYPSASASFLASELLEDIGWLSLAKLRFGWAQVGNDTDPYKVKAVYDYNDAGPFQGAPRLAADNDLVNADLKAETTTSIEGGIDLSVIQNRISLSFTYFNNVTTDQIMPLEVSKASGYDTKWINAGQMTNKGIEITLGLTPVRIDNFEWNIMANYTKVQNTLDELYAGLDALDIVRFPFGGIFLRASVGDAYGQLWGTDYLYDDAGNKIVTSSGNWDVTENLVPLGSVLPDYTMGIRNSFTIMKAIDLSVLFDIRKGGKMYSVSHMFGTYSGMLEASAGVNDLGNEIRSPVSEGGGIKLDGVTADVTHNPDGTYTVENTAPNETYAEGSAWAHRHYHGYGTPSAQSVFNQDFIKLRELTIGYSLPAKILGPIQSAKISLYGRNLLTFGLDEEGFDPEAYVNGSGNIQGVDGGIYPSSRTFGVNVQLGF